MKRNRDEKTIRKRSTCSLRCYVYWRYYCFFGCMLFGEPEKTDEEKMVKAFINDFIDEKYEKIKRHMLLKLHQFDAAKPR